MRRLSQMLIVLLIAGQIAAVGPAAGEDQFKALVSAYNAHDYQKAARCGESVIQKQPNNAEARYYLANSYAQLKQMDLAEAQYRRCMQLAPNSQLAQNSSAALKSISRYLSPPKKTSGGGKKKQNKRGHAVPSSPEEQQIWNEAQQRIQMKETDANEQIAKIRMQAKEDLSSIPKKGRRRHRNPSYAPAKADINGQADEKVAKIKRALANDKKDILNDADQRISNLKK